MRIKEAVAATALIGAVTASTAGCSGSHEKSSDQAQNKTHLHAQKLGKRLLDAVDFGTTQPGATVYIAPASRNYIGIREGQSVTIKNGTNKRTQVLVSAKYPSHLVPDASKQCLDTYAAFVTVNAPATEVITNSSLLDPSRIASVGLQSETWDSLKQCHSQVGGVGLKDVIYSRERSAPHLWGANSFTPEQPNEHEVMAALIAGQP